MAGAPEDTADGGPTYIRGSGAIDIDASRLGRVVLAACVLILAALAVVTTVEADGQNSTQGLLAHHGVPVKVSVDGCVATGSGVGQGTSYYTCRGTYFLSGRAYSADIGGTREAYPVGATISAVAVPGHPSVLATAASAHVNRSELAAYVTPIVLWAATLSTGIGLWVWVSRSRRTAHGAEGVPTR